MIRFNLLLLAGVLLSHIHTGVTACLTPTLEFRSCTGNRAWCGFEPFEPVWPPTKYRTYSLQDSASGYSTNHDLSWNGASFSGYQHACSGPVTFSASSTSTNWWAVYPWVRGGQWGSITSDHPGSLVSNTIAGDWPSMKAWQDQWVTSGRIDFTPDSPGSCTIHATEDCVWTTNSTGPFLHDNALTPSIVDPTSMVLVNKSTWSPATRSLFLTDEYKRTDVAARILEDLAACPAGAWGLEPECAASSLYLNTLTLRKVAYRIGFRSEPGITYYLTWDELVDYGGAQTPIRISHVRTMQGNGNWVSVEGVLLPPLDRDGRASVDLNSVKIKSGADCAGDCNGVRDPGSGAVALNNVDIVLDLGQGNFGMASGQLRINQSTMSAALSTPAALQFLGDSSAFETISTEQGLRQARGTQCLANILTNSPCSYDVAFYAISNVIGFSQGLYQVAGAPYATWRILNPDGASSVNRLQAIEIRDGKSITNEVQWSAETQTWTLVSGNGLRTETKRLEWDAANQVQTETLQVFTGASQLVSQEIKKYKVTSLGPLLVEEHLGTAGSMLSITNSYDGIGGLHAYVQRMVRSDGYWESYQYVTGWLWQVYSPLGNAAPTLGGEPSRSFQRFSTTSSWLPGDDGTVEPWAPRHTLSFLNNQCVSLNWYGYAPGMEVSLSGLAPTAHYSNPDKYGTTNYFYTNGPFAGHLQSICHPDGTADAYFYETNASLRTTITLHGELESGSTTNVVRGTRTVMVTGLAGQMFSNLVCALPDTSLVLSREIYSDFDDLFRPRRVTYLDGAFTQASYNCCGLEYLIDREGTRTDYSYDDLKRLQSETRNGITFIYTYDGAGRILSKTRQPAGGGSSVAVERVGYDTLGRLVARTNALGAYSQYLEYVVSNQVVRVTIQPDLSTITNLYFRDGTLQEVCGSAAPPLRYEYGIVIDGYRKLFATEYRLDASGGVQEWSRTHFDGAGLPCTKLSPTAFGTNAVESLTYSKRWQLTNQVDADGVIRLYAYNRLGELTHAVLDTNRNYQIDWSSSDRITFVSNEVAQAYGTAVHRTRTWEWSPGANTSNLVSTVEISTDGRKTWNTVWNDGLAVAHRTETTYDAANGYRYITNISPDTAFSVLVTRYGTNVSLSAYDPGGALLSRTTFEYDSHGRQNRVIDARNGATTFTFDDADQVLTVTSPSPGPGQSAQVLTQFPDAMGRIGKSTFPDNTSVTNEYHPTGLLWKRSGSREYPVEYTHDTQGRLKTQTTWRAHPDQPAVTSWNYDSQRGWLAGKKYPDPQTGQAGSSGPGYTYTPGGRLQTRTGERGWTATYRANNAGEVDQVTYSDGQTANVLNTFNRRGQLEVVDQGASQTTFTYNGAGQKLRETYVTGPLAGLMVTNGYDHLMRRTNLSLIAPNGAVLSQTSYSYVSASRLAVVSSGGICAGYKYVVNSALVGEIGFTNAGVEVLRTISSHDALDRLTNIVSLTNGTVLSQHAYLYNAANQRTRATLADNSYWVYGFDSLGQVTSGKKYWSDGTPMAGQQFEYGFDTIGNRTNAATGGDALGGALRPSEYSGNALNQSTNRTVPGYVDVIGTANSSATVTLWADNGSFGQTSRKGEYFRGEVSANNATGSVWLTITNIAVLGGGSEDIITNTIGSRLLSQSPQTFAYDPDGNLTNDGVWAYTWDAENRLVAITNLSTVPALARKALTFAYDSLSRRTSKTVYTNDGASFVPSSTNYFIYDTWNLIAVLGPQSTVLQSFVWGLDLSGSLHGAGGVGGLLAIRDQSTINHQPSTHFASYDGNGNVMALVNAADGSISAQYEYGPFGESVRATGPMAKANPFRFSSKYQDEEAGLLYYDRRYYDPVTGRWLTRDPIGEEGGVNLYGFVGNDPVNFIDPFGENTFSEFASLTFHPRNMGYNLNLGYNYAAGVGRGAVGAVAGMAMMAAHPLETAKGLWALRNLTTEQLRCLLGRQWERFMNASPQEQAAMIGRLVGDIEAGLAVGGLADKAVDAIRAARAARTMDDLTGLRRVEDLSQGGEFLDDAIRFAGELENAAKGTPWTQVSSDARAILRDVESRTGMSVPGNPRSLLANQVRAVDHRVPVSDVQYRALQAEYRANRGSMISQWEANTGQVWPSGAQAHHIIPTRYGGPNQWWNIHPAQGGAVHQGGIHGVGSPTQTVFPTPVR